MRASWPSSWRLPGGRFGAAVALAILAVRAAALALLDPSVPADTVSMVGSWRFEVATSAALVALAVALRARPGLAFALLAFASSSISGEIESMSLAVRSLETPVGAPPSVTNADVLLALAVFERTVIPAAILTLYATAPDRRLAPWVSAVGWGITIATLAAPFLRVARDAASRSEVWTMPWWNDLSFQLDQPVPLFIVAALGMLGSLRAAARGSAPAMRDDRPPVVPDRRLLAAAGVAVLFWAPATVAFLGRPASTNEGMDLGDALAWLPILFALVGIVSVRWSRVVAWCAIAAAYEAVALLVLFRAVGDYVALIQLQPPGVVVDPQPAFWILVAVACGIVLFAFVAVSLAFLAAWRPAQPTPADERRWAIRGGLLGIGVCAWYVAAGLSGEGLGMVVGIVFAPVYLMPIAVAILAWRRLVPAVAEAELVATNPLRPLRYLEIVVAEVLTRRAEHERRAAFRERDRVATELEDLRATIGRLMTDRGLALAPVGGGPWGSQVDSGLRRPSDREIDVIRLLVTGASNDEIAAGLVLSLKTVETHLRRLFARYDVTNRTELAVLAVREGWVEPSQVT
ncbi:MAG TPA: LuxR C-terminal-related transcriptional regulator [Candidatus Limnocylindrales bacterium]|nr:LuxR C-terminal-related transcriptional regulator [Candidatus Limnocylindrales bacterium]